MKKFAIALCLLLAVATVADAHGRLFHGALLRRLFHRPAAASATVVYPAQQMYQMVPMQAAPAACAVPQVQPQPQPTPPAKTAPKELPK